MKKNCLIVVMLLLGYPVLAQNTTMLLNRYYMVKDALVNSDSKAVSEAIADFQQAIKADTFKEKESLTAVVSKLAKAGSLEKQRAAFNDVSVLMWQVVKSADKAGQPVYYQYCPMKKTYWLSNDSAIKNPYYGASMLTCGKVSDTKK